jgi:hypothetical protein
MRQTTKKGPTIAKRTPGEIRPLAVQDQIDAVMDSFDFSMARRIAETDEPGSPHEEKTLRKTARKVLQGAAESGGWATGGGFSAFLQEWRSQPGKGALKISLFYGPSSLLEPHTEFSEDEVRKVTP